MEEHRMGLFSKVEYRSVFMDYKFKESEGLPCIQATDGTYGGKIYPVFCCKLPIFCYNCEKLRFLEPL